MSKTLREWGTKNDVYAIIEKICKVYGKIMANADNVNKNWNEKQQHQQLRQKDEYAKTRNEQL